ncbi:DUF2690 domain-containing protein [Actinomycetospora sp. TBRC 11914]|uniref:DUF2690 domain-containing protein n=1 Tax=Actinomycetospora sp. TBRC 11914 TaxID=2729387 RepID=UPI00145E3724|nr:DUF2690 domain-containing protein [Actinomycetospora sp. TBRC 11914]NMO90375.1 DUF2690 domain-containing protein [Actinomycetospora sp. TBRC 11914]
MTTLLDPTRSRTTAFPAARRSDPSGIRTASIAPPPTTEPEPPVRSTPPWPRRGALLLGAAVAIAGAAAVVAFTTPAPLPPLPPAPTVTSTPCGGGSCEGLDPTTTGCQQDARTVGSRVVTAERRGLEVPVGLVELRASASCRAVWGRYTVDPTAPVGGVAVESRDGRTEQAPIAAVPGHRHLGYGTTPMLVASADDLRVVVTPAAGGELPSAATGWTSGTGRP